MDKRQSRLWTCRRGRRGEHSAGFGPLRSTDTIVVFPPRDFICDFLPFPWPWMGWTQDEDQSTGA